MDKKEFTFIDLFAGIGGFRLGLEAIGGKCVFSSEIDEHCQNTYEKNFGERPHGDIRLIDEKEIPDHDILCAGFPCQPFSISGQKRGFEDTRGTVFFEIMRIAKEKKPQILFLENVKFLLHHDKGRTLEIILDSIKSLGYYVSFSVLNASQFDVPQNRERIVFIASKKKPFDFENLKTKKKTDKVLSDILQSEEDFDFLKPEEYTLLENPKSQTSGLIFAGYRNKTQRERGVRLGTEHLSRAHRQPNRIYSAEGIYPTIPSQEPSGRFFTLLGDGRVRRLTLRECYRLMGFPDAHEGVGNKSEQYRQIGNSICVLMVEKIGKEILSQGILE